MSFMPPHLRELLARRAEEERQIIQIMTLFPAYYRHYKVRPTLHSHVGIA